MRSHEVVLTNRGADVHGCLLQNFGQLRQLRREETMVSRFLLHFDGAEDLLLLQEDLYLIHRALFMAGGGDRGTWGARIQHGWSRYRWGIRLRGLTEKPSLHQPGEVLQDLPPTGEYLRGKGSPAGLQGR